MFIQFVWNILWLYKWVSKCIATCKFFCKIFIWINLNELYVYWNFNVSLLQFLSFTPKYIYILTDLCHLSDKCLPYMIIILHFGGSSFFCSVVCDFRQYQNPRPASIFNPCLIPLYNIPFGCLSSSNMIITVTKT